MPPNEAAAFSQFASQPPAAPPAAPAAPAPGAPAAPDPNAAPAWADQLLQTVSGLRTEFDAFKNEVTAPIEDEPAPAPAPQPGEWVPQTYEDVDKRIIERAQEISAAALAERDRQAQQAAQQAAQQEQEIEAYLDQQVAALEQANLLPRVANPALNDPNDPGRRARAELFGYAYSLGTTNISSVANTLKSLHDQGLRYDVTQGKLAPITGSAAPGASAPIAGGTPNGTVNQNGTPPANFFRTHDLDMVAEYAKRAIQ